MYTYVDGWTAVRVGNGFSEDFQEKVCVHHGAVFTPLLLINVMQVITKHLADKQKLRLHVKKRLYLGCVRPNIMYAIINLGDN